MKMRLRSATWTTFLTCTQYHSSQGQLCEVTTPLSARTWSSARQLHVASSIEPVDSEHAENSRPKQLSDPIRVNEPHPPFHFLLPSLNAHHTLSTDISHL